MAEIGLEKIEMYAFHGFYPEERRVGSRYQIDLYVELELDREAWDDSISETVNYEELYAICAEEMELQQKLIETVALRILNRTKALSPQIQAARIELRKLNPPIYGQIGSACVKLTI